MPSGARHSPSRVVTAPQAADTQWRDKSRGSASQPMEDTQFGARVRAVRMKQRRTQKSVATQARVRRIEVSYVERGLLGDLPLHVIRDVVSALGAWLELQPKWHGVDLARLTSGAHDALQGSLLEFFDRLPGWVAVPEATYSIFGERGAVDILAWHEATRSLLVIELKTVLVDKGEIARKMDERRRLAPEIAAARGWKPTTVSTWLILSDTRTNRREVARNAALLRHSEALDGHAMRAWLRQPIGAVSGISFWPASDAVIRRRVRPTKAEKAAEAERGATAEAKAAAVAAKVAAKDGATVAGWSRPTGLGRARRVT